MRLRYVAYTSPGIGKTRNEDAVMGEASLGLFAVADGVGSTGAAALAARHAVAALREHLLDLLTREEPPDIQRALTEGVQAAHARVRQLSRREGVSAASTLLVARIEREWLTLAHVGDGAAWIWRGDVLERVSGGDALSDLAMAEGFGRLHRAEKGLLDAVGAGDRIPTPRLAQRRWYAFDWLVLATDGIVERLTGPAIESLVAEAAREHRPESLPERLVRTAQDAGARDDCTVLVAWRP